MSEESPKMLDKKKIVDFLKHIGIIQGNFTGKVSFNVNGGAICDIERVERLK